MTDRSTDFIAARDLLLEARTDRARAVRDFRWPSMPVFNWALDYFDAIARGNDRPALWVVAEDGGEQKVTYADLSARSNQLANWLRAQGVRRGDRILLMLPNVPPLWQTMLAAMKLGAVVIPATTLLVGDELRDRLERGGARFVIAMTDQCAKFNGMEKDLGLIAVGGGAPAGWTAYEGFIDASADFTPDGETR